MILIVRGISGKSGMDSILPSLIFRIISTLIKRPKSRRPTKKMPKKEQRKILRKLINQSSYRVRQTPGQYKRSKRGVKNAYTCTVSNVYKLTVGSTPK